MMEVGIRDMVGLLEVKRGLRDSDLSKNLDSFIIARLSVLSSNLEDVSLDELRALQSFLEFEEYVGHISDIFYELGKRGNLAAVDVVRDLDDSVVLRSYAKGLIEAEGEVKYAVKILLLLLGGLVREGSPEAKEYVDDLVKRCDSEWAKKLEDPSIEDLKDLKPLLGMGEFRPSMMEIARSLGHVEEWLIEDVVSLLDEFDDEGMWRAFLEGTVDDAKPGKLMDLLEHVLKHGDDSLLDRYLEALDRNFMGWASEKKENAVHVVRSLRVLADNQNLRERIKNILYLSGYYGSEKVLEPLADYEDPELIRAGALGIITNEESFKWSPDAVLRFVKLLQSTDPFLCSTYVGHWLKSSSITGEITEDFVKEILSLNPLVVEAFLRAAERTFTGDWIKSKEPVPSPEILIILRPLISTPYKERVGKIFYTVGFVDKFATLREVMAVLKEIDDEYIYERFSEGVIDDTMEDVSYPNIEWFSTLFSDPLIGHFFMKKVGEEEVSALLLQIRDIHKSPLILENDIDDLSTDKYDATERSDNSDLGAVRKVVKSALQRLIRENRKGRRTLEEVGLHTAILARKLRTTGNLRRVG